MKNDILNMDEELMAMALSEAMMGAAMGEIPVGAVIVKDGEVISATHNLRENGGGATAHAELLAINEACEILGSWRLSGCELYVTLEPCVMCTGAILNSRIENVYFGAYISNGSISAVELSKRAELNHRTNFYGGYFEEENSSLVSSYFQGKRKTKKK